MCRVTPVEEVRGQLCGVGILSSPLCGFWEPNSGHQVCTASVFYLLSHPLAPTGALSFVFLRQDAMSSGWPQTPCEARAGFERLPDLTVSTFEVPGLHLYNTTPDKKNYGFFFLYS